MHIDAALAVVDSSGALSVTIAGLPAGAMLSAGIQNSDGSWTLTPDQLVGLTLTPPTNYAGTVEASVTATSSENGTSASIAATLPVEVETTALAPVVAIQAAIGNENTSIALHVDAGLAAGDAGGSLAVTISGLPTGATLSAGVQNADGTYTLTAAELTGLTLTPPAQFAGTLALDITATTSENGTTASTTVALPVTVQETASAPVLTGLPVIGLENASVALTLGVSTPGLDSNEIISLTVSGVPAGATLSAGVQNSDGTWTLTPQQAVDLTLTPPQNFSGDANLTVTATASEHGTTASATLALPISILPIALPPALTVAAAVGIEDASIALQIGAAFAQAAPGETLSITVSNLPAGATLSAGVQNADGSYTLTAAELTGLTLTPPTHFNGALNLAVTATTGENGTSATAVASLPVQVAPIALTPTLAVQAAVGLQDMPVVLPIAAALVAADPSETLTVTIAGVPAGATLSAGCTMPMDPTR